MPKKYSFSAPKVELYREQMLFLKQSCMKDSQMLNFTIFW